MAVATQVSRSRVHFGSHWGRANTSVAPKILRFFSQPQSIRVSAIPCDMHVKIASTRSEWEQAFELVADNYQARGYEIGGFRYRFTLHHALPETIVLVAKEGARVLATLSLVPDNDLLGLPMESLYRVEAQQLRRQGHRIIETTCLADRALCLHDFGQVFVALMRLGWQYWKARGYDTNVITVTPRHGLAYTRVFGYQPLGPRRSYALVQGTVAEAFCLDPEQMRVRSPAMYQRIFGERLPTAALRSVPMPIELLHHFARNSSQTNPKEVEQVLWQLRQCGSPRRLVVV